VQTGAVVLGLSVRDALLGDAMRNLYRRDNVVLAPRVDVGVLRVVRNVLQAQARSCASVVDARPRVSGSTGDAINKCGIVASGAGSVHALRYGPDMKQIFGR
jgi:hypothetical protein